MPCVPDLPHHLRGSLPAPCRRSPCEPATPSRARSSLFASLPSPASIPARPAPRIRSRPSSGGHRPIGLRRRGVRQRAPNPTAMAVRARRPPVRLPAGRPAARDQERRAAAPRRSSPSPSTQRRARPAGRRVRPGLRHQSASSTSTTPPPRPPSTTASAASPPTATSPWPAARRMLLDLDNLSSATNHNGGAHPLRPGRQALRRGRRERERRQRADPRQPARQDAAHQRGRHHPHRQPVLRHRHRKQPRDLGAGPAQPVHLRVPARHRPDVHQRRRREHLGRDQRRHRGLELRLADHRRADHRCRASASRSSPTATRRRRHRLRDHRRRLLQPDHRAVPRRLPRRLLLRRLLRRLDPPARPRHRAPPPAFADRRSRSPVDLKVSDDGSLYYLARGDGTVRPGPRPTRPARRPTITAPAAEPRPSPSGQPATFSVARLRARRRSATSGSATAPTSPARPRRPTPSPRSRRCRQRRAFPRPWSPTPFGTATSNGGRPDRDARTQPPTRHHHRARRRHALHRAATRSTTPAPAPIPKTAPCPPAPSPGSVDFHHDTHIHPFIAADHRHHERLVHDPDARRDLGQRLVSAST